MRARLPTILAGAVVASVLPILFSTIAVAMSSPGPSTTPSPAASGRGSAGATPSLAATTSPTRAVPTFVPAPMVLWVTPREGVAGGTVTIRGSGFWYPACSKSCPGSQPPTVDLYWDGVRFGVPVPVRADTTVIVTIVVPGPTTGSPAGGAHTIEARQTTGTVRSAQATFRLTPTPVRASPATVGQPVPRTSPTPAPRSSPTPPAPAPAVRIPTTVPAPTRPGTVATQRSSAGPAAVLGGPAAPPGGTIDPPSPSPSPTPTESTTPAPTTAPMNVAGQDAARVSSMAADTSPASDGWTRPELVTSVRLLNSLGDLAALGGSPFGLALLLVAIAAFAFLAVGLPADLANRTYQANKTAIHEGIRLPAIRQRLWWITPGQSTRPWPAVAVCSVLSGTFIAFAEPNRHRDGEFGEFIMVALALMVAVPLVAISYEFAIEATRRREPLAIAAKLHVVYPAVIVAGLCAAVSHLVGISPGYAYGLIVAYAVVAPHRSREGQAAARVLRGAAVLLAFALGAWAIRQWGIADAAGQDGASFGARLVDTVLGMITFMSLQTFLIGLIPLRTLHGETMWRWNRGAWSGCYAVGAAIFFVVLSGPVPVVDLNFGRFLEMMWLVITFALAAYAFWGFFVVRDEHAQNRAPQELTNDPTDVLPPFPTAPDTTTPPTLRRS